MVNRRLTGGNLHLYLNPERSSHPDALKVHGLTDDFLADKPLFADVADELLAFLAGAEVVIHNAAFDVGFVERRASRAWAGPLRRRMSAASPTALADGARDVPGKANSLDALCRRLEVDNSHRTLHGALLDAGLLAEVYIRMTRGQGSLVIDSHRQRPRRCSPGRASTCAAFTLPVVLASADERGPRGRAGRPGQGQRRQDGLAQHAV
jgi:DNA polymerase-3 subunit epsilon